MHSIDFTSPGVWVSLVTLCFLEVVLGIDNIIFISLITGKLPEAKQARVRNIGLLLAMFFRIGLLLSISWIISMKEPIVTIPAFFSKDKHELALSYKDLILIAGGLFLLIKSTLEIHHKLKKENKQEAKAIKERTGMLGIILQIVVIDMVFSFDSILTAVGLVDEVLIMIIAVVVSIIIMMLFSGAVSKIINRHPSLQMLALSFLVVIGVALMASAFHEEISKSIIYSCLGFSLGVEMLNIRLRKNEKQIHLND
jgi:predicted tellurium resistance membrane protein TerC